jgi:hypothetical protein
VTAEGGVTEGLLEDARGARGEFRHGQHCNG